MGFVVTNRGMSTLLTSAITATTDIRQAVFTGAPPAVAALRDMKTIADLAAVMTEATAVGYARADLVGVAVTEDDAGDRVVLSAAAPTYAAVAAGETWTAAAYYIEDASDGSRTLLAVDVPADPQITNGASITGPALTLQLTNGV